MQLLVNHIPSKIFYPRARPQSVDILHDGSPNKPKTIKDTILQADYFFSLTVVDFDVPQVALLAASDPS